MRVVSQHLSFLTEKEEESFLLCGSWCTISAIENTSILGLCLFLIVLLS
jgi:hypothetical protein